MPSLRLFDTHCHLDFPVFDGSRAALLAACRACGVERIVIPGVTAQHWGRVLACCAEAPMLLPALGMHPCFLDGQDAADLQRLAELLVDPSVVAVGEIGIDLWHGRQQLARQIAVFDRQLDLAEQFNLPVLLHVRKAHDEVLARLRRRSRIKGGIVHAFSGSLQQAHQYAELNFCVGIGGALTYPRATRLAAVLAALPVEALVLETDAPDMPLHGYQGQANRPDRLPLVLSSLAAVRQQSDETLAEQLWRNSCSVLGLA